MGTENSILNVNDCVQFVGALEQQRPEGKGRIIIFADPAHREKLAQFSGTFQGGHPTSGEAVFGNLKYTGETHEGRFTGQGILVDSKSNKTFKGKFNNGVLVMGEIVKENGYKCSGEFSQSGQSSPQGKLYRLVGEAFYESISNKQVLRGVFRQGNLTENGRYQLKNGFQYEGQLRQGYFQGEGKYTSTAGEIAQVEGVFKESMVHSYPENFIQKIAFANGDQYKGCVKSNRLHGEEGTYTFKDGTIIRGSFYEHSLNGECEITYGESSAVQKYYGQVNEGLYNGLGNIEYKNGVIVKGYFYQNTKNGPCLLIFGQRMFKCLFIMDRLIGDITEV